MTPIEILHKIVDTENEAREIYEEAVLLRDSFDDYVQAKLGQLKTTYFDRADEEIAQAEQREIARADREIEELDNKLKTELDAAKDRYEGVRETVVLKIFKLAVNADA